MTPDHAITAPARRGPPPLYFNSSRDNLGGVDVGVLQGCPHFALKVVDVGLEVWAVFVITVVAGSFATFFSSGDSS
jgi:hypothetical protein